jgi:hypothetical protein
LDTALSVAFVKSCCDWTASGWFGLMFTFVSLSLSQAVRPATNGRSDKRHHQELLSHQYMVFR